MKLDSIIDKHLFDSRALRTTSLGVLLALSVAVIAAARGQCRPGTGQADQPVGRLQWASGSGRKR